MDGPNGGSNAPAPFLTKTYEMVEDQLTNSIVSWSQNGHSFVVWNPLDFASNLLPKYFKHNNFSSFVRQLNTYGFRKIDPDQWEFANEDFVRGQRHLLKNIYRRKPIHSHSGQGNSAIPLADTERKEFEQEIERLSHDKNSLQLELQKQKQENQGFEYEVHSTGVRLHGIVNRQKQLMEVLAELMQEPKFASSFEHYSETHNKKRRLLLSGFLHEEANMGMNHTTPLEKDSPDAISVQAVNLEVVEKLQSSLNFWENFMDDVGLFSNQQEGDLMMLQQPSHVLITEMHSTSSDSDLNVRPCSTDSSPESGDYHSSRDLAVSSSHLDSPAISSIYLSLDPQQKSSGIDVNTRPATVPDVDVPKDQDGGTMAATVPAVVNDVFWQQFLMETPGSTDSEEVQSEIRLASDGMSENKPTDYQKFRWNMTGIDNLTEKMGHLTQAGTI